MTECPTQQFWQAVLEQRLPAAQEEALSLHAEGCHSCRQVLETITCAPDLSLVRQVRDTHDSRALLQAPLLSRFAASVDQSSTSLGLSALPETDRLPVLPGYELLEVLGSGGMGVVFKARHIELNRIVALKMLREGALPEKELHARFRDEARAVARLQHPGIVQIHEVGTLEGRPYLTLEYVPGPSLDRVLAGSPLAPRDAATLLLPLAEALQAAHEQGVLHRDLKPANVLLSFSRAPEARAEDLSFSRAPEARALDNATRALDNATRAPDTPDRAEDNPAHARENSARAFGARLNELVPKITDFGLAKPLHEDSGRTETGMIVGTPSYMAPEQAAGERKLGPAVDVYALGAILYECLTGRPPFKGVTTHDTVQQVLTGEPVPPRRLQPAIPHDLETICLKCLHKEPAQRYVSATALAADVRRFLDGRPIQARPVSRLERTWRWCRRNPVVAGLTAVVMLVLAVASVTGWLLAAWAFQAEETAQRESQQTKQERDVAERERQRAEKNLAQARRAVDETLLVCRDNELFQGEAMRLHRRLLLDKALPFYRDFVQQTGDAPAIRAEQAELLRYLACTYSEVGHAAAVPTCREALAIYERLAAAHPQVPAYQEGLVHTWNSLGVIHRELGQKTDALACFQRAQECAAKLVAVPSPSLEHQDILSKAWSQVAQAQRALGQERAARESLTRTLQLLEELAAARPGEMAYQAAMAYTWNDLALLHDRQKQPRDVARCYAAARRSAERLVAAQPQSLEYAVMLGGISCNLGQLEVRLGRPRAALPPFAQAIRVLRDALDREPQYANAGVFLRNTFNSRSRALEQLRRASAAWLDAGRASALDGEARNLRREELLARTQLLAQGEHGWLTTLSGSLAARGGGPACLATELVPWLLWVAPEPER